MPEKPPPPPTFAHRMEWLALRGVMAWIRRGSIDDAARRCGRLVPLVRRIFHKEWSWTLANLTMVYGDRLTPSQREQLALKIVENIILSHGEALRPQDVLFANDQVDHLKEAYQLNRGVILCSLHIGSWEPGMRRISRLGFPLTVVYRHANNPLSEQEFTAIRAEYGTGFVRRRDTRGALRILQKKQILGLMVDINTKRGGVAAPFLDIPAMCPSGPARLALKFKCPLVGVIGIRHAPGHASLLSTPPIEPTRFLSQDKALEALTTEVNRAVAPWIHRYTEQWNWLHARWRARPDGSLWKPPQAIIEGDQQRTNPTRPLDERIQKLLEG